MVNRGLKWYETSSLEMKLSKRRVEREMSGRELKCREDFEFMARFIGERHGNPTEAEVLAGIGAALCDIRDRMARPVDFKDFAVFRGMDDKQNFVELIAAARCVLGGEIDRSKTSGETRVQIADLCRLADALEPYDQVEV